MSQKVRFGILLLKYYFRYITFWFRLHVPVDKIRIFFNFRFCSRKSQSQQKPTKNISHFTIQFLSKNLIYLMNLNLNLNGNENNILPQQSRNPFHFKNFPANMVLFGVRKKNCRNCAVPYLDAQKLRQFLKHFEGKCLYISLYLRVCMGGRGWLNTGWRWLFGPRKMLHIFHFNWNFWKFNYFPNFVIF